jgi:hypothetical protein
MEHNLGCPRTADIHSALGAVDLVASSRANYQMRRGAPQDPL